MSALLAFAARMRFGTVVTCVIVVLLLASIAAARHYRERAANLEAALESSNSALQRCTDSNADAHRQLDAVRAASEKLAAEAAEAARVAGEERKRIERALTAKAAAPLASTCEAAIVELSDELAKESTR